MFLLAMSIRQGSIGHLVTLYVDHATCHNLLDLNKPALYGRLDI